MDICIGGPWDAAKVLKNEIYERNFFKVKIKGSNTVTTYKKRSASIESVRYTFWVSTDISDVEAIKRIQHYLSRRKKLSL
ncbi:hypothetical protein [Acinetobacter rudis]|uniref:Uncharacterized protein n=1 Tax=Acinetobacter rudis CIP 110305 TaxID=421052 RepID=S3N175_9GAMM|nr:hypothetical protein [Acinetobacter rudis]EPF73870.1 hypothetical protein F945_01749 [Acinetobacter rudis CIP 110305]